MHFKSSVASVANCRSSKKAIANRQSQYNFDIIVHP